MLYLHTPPSKTQRADFAIRYLGLRFLLLLCQPPAPLLAAEQLN
jgi:hypothetical protein